MSVFVSTRSGMFFLPTVGSKLVKLPEIEFNELPLRVKVELLKYYLDFIKEGNNNLTWSIFNGYPGNFSEFDLRIRGFLEKYNTLTMMNELDMIELSIVKIGKNSYKLAIHLMEENYASLIDTICIDEDDSMKILNVFAESSVYNEYLGCCIWQKE